MLPLKGVLFFIIASIFVIYFNYKQASIPNISDETFFAIQITSFIVYLASLVCAMIWEATTLL